MDSIVLSGVHASGADASPDFERHHRRDRVVDATLFLDLNAAESVAHETLDIGRIAETIASIIDDGHASAIVPLAERIAERLLDIKQVRRVEITVREPHTHDAAPFDAVAVTITRGRAATEHQAPVPQSRRAIISLESTEPDAERLFREAIVTLDGIPGNQVEGISPLYHVSALDGPDAMSAVIQIVTKLGADDLIDTLSTIEAAHDKAVDLDVVDMEGVNRNDPHCRVPWPSARRRAAVLAPWMDMDPNATLAGDPVAFLLAQAEDADRVGLLSDAWILGSA